MKRTHRKVQSGCDVCRRRRVKCDELKPQCTRCRRWTATRGVPLACRYTAGKAALEVTAQSESPSCVLRSTASHRGWPNPASGVEAALLNHLCVLRNELRPAAEWGLLAGVNQFSRFLALAGNFEHLRYTFCSLSASHRRTLTQSAAMAEVETRYRLMAVQSMIAELDNIGSQSVTSHHIASQALMASATLMAWYSADPQEYCRLLAGIFAFYPDQARGTGTACRTDSIQKSDAAAFGDSHGESGEIYAVLGEITEALAELSRCKLDVELRAAVKDLSNFIYNIRHLPLGSRSRQEQLSAMFPIRNWLRFVPRAPKQFAAGGDFPLYLYLASYETTMLVMGSVLPCVGIPLAIEERRACVGRIRNFLRGRIPHAAGCDAVDTARVYKAYVRWISVAEGAIKATSRHPIERIGL